MKSKAFKYIIKKKNNIIRINKKKNKLNKK